MDERKLLKKRYLDQGSFRITKLKCAINFSILKSLKPELKCLKYDNEKFIKWIIAVDAHEIN